MNKCKECDKQISNPKFCSRSCSRVYQNKKRKGTGWYPYKREYSSDRIHQQVRFIQKSLEEAGIKNVEVIEPFSLVRFSLCNITGKPFRSTNIEKGHGRIQRSPYIELTKKEKYYQEAQFTFNVYDYSEEFDLNLIEKYGWYSTPGSRNGIRNLNGISRDHRLSISEGFRLGVDPKIISHPSNCQLLLHRKNNEKDRSSSISLVELQRKIKKWNKKYSK